MFILSQGPFSFVPHALPVKSYAKKAGREHSWAGGVPCPHYELEELPRSGDYVGSGTGSGISQQTVRNSIVHHLFVLFFSSYYYLL